MYKILKAEKLAEKIFLMDVEAPRVAKHCEPGQFIIVKMDEKGERIPLTICDYDREAGTITIVFQIVGASTEKMSHLKAGDAFSDFVGPLGCPSELIHEDIEELKKQKIVFIAGGVGTAPVYPQVKWLHEHGVDADVIVGAKNKDLILLEDEMKAVAGNLYITTDDGSYVRKGHIIARHDVGYHLTDMIAAFGKRRVEVKLVAIRHEPLRMRIINMDGRKLVLQRSLYPIRINPGMKLHAPLVALLNHKLHRVPIRFRGFALHTC